MRYRRSKTAKRPPTDTPCGYCFNNWATCYDHLRPVSVGGRNKDSNLYPSCSRCNGLLSNKVFTSIEEKQAYIQGLIDAALG